MPKKIINPNGGEKHPHRDAGSYIGNNDSNSTSASIAEYETLIVWRPNVSVGAQGKTPVGAGAAMKGTGVGYTLPALKPHYASLL